MIQTEDAARRFVAERCCQRDFERTEAFVRMLVDETHLHNLISRSSISSVWRRHVADSAQLQDYVSRETGVWLDLGTGAGFPGLVLAMMRPGQRFVLVESRRLRIEWLRQVVDQLKIANCEVIGSDLKGVTTFEADVISARAFAPLDRLVALSARFSTSATQWVLPKGRSARQEVEMLPPALQAMFHVKQSLTDPNAGIVVGTGRAP